MILNYLMPILIIFGILGVISLAVYTLLNIIYPRAPRRTKIETSLILGFLGLVIISSISSFLILIVLIIIGLGLMHGLKKI